MNAAPRAAPLRHAQAQSAWGVQAPQTPEAQDRVVPGSAPHSHMSQSNQASLQGVCPQTLEVFVAVQSLYDDQLKPYGRILRKRLVERSSRGGITEVDTRQLTMLCQSCPWLRVQSEDGGDWSVLCANRAPYFVDVYSPNDPYPPSLWAAAAAYFQSLEGTEMTLPGGRYSCAQALASRRLPFLEGRSLGEVCHIVQLAISQKKLLGYLSGSVVPYHHSQSMVKELCAEKGTPITSPSRASTSLATWDRVPECLQQLMDSAAQGAGSIPLSNVKRLFRSRFHLELSETALGHAKLSELLQDERLRDICSVRLQGHGYVVMPRTGSMSQSSAAISLSDSLAQSNMPPQPNVASSAGWHGVAASTALPAADGRGEQQRKQAQQAQAPRPGRRGAGGARGSRDGLASARGRATVAPLSMDSIHANERGQHTQQQQQQQQQPLQMQDIQDGCDQRVTAGENVSSKQPPRRQNTPPTPMSGSSQRSQSTPKDEKCCREESSTSGQHSSPTLPHEASQTESSLPIACKTLKMKATRSQDEANMDRINTDSTYAPPTINSGSSDEGEYDRVNTMLSIEEEEEPRVRRRVSLRSGAPPRRRITVCPVWPQDDEPWQEETFSPVVGSQRQGLNLSSLPRLSAWPVQNTFIHAAPMPPTPPAGSNMRSQSVPRSMGSRLGRFFSESDSSSASNPTSPRTVSLANGAPHGDQSSDPCTAAPHGDQTSAPRTSAVPDAPGRIEMTPELAPAGGPDAGGPCRNVVLLADLI